MKWKMFKLLMPLLMLVFVVPMILPGPNGKPAMSPADWLPSASSIERSRATLLSWWRRATTGLKENTGIDVTPEPEQLYKWQDANGTWHFTNRADKAASDAQRQAMPTATNTMAPPPVVERDHESAAAPRPSLPLPLPTTVPVDKIPELIDDAKKLQKLSQDRAREINDI
jgi:hypothetical protein